LLFFVVIFFVFSFAFWVVICVFAAGTRHVASEAVSDATRRVPTLRLQIYTLFL